MNVKCSEITFLVPAVFNPRTKSRFRPDRFDLLPTFRSSLIEAQAGAPKGCFSGSKDLRALKFGLFSTKTKA